MRARPRKKRNALSERLRRELAAVARPEKAGPMQAYMKSAMPFLGVPAKDMRAACKRAFATYFERATARGWRRDVLALFRGAKFREERYGAMELAGDRRAAEFRTLEALPVYEAMMIREGAWWDIVDLIASHRVGELLAREPEKMKPILLEWSCSDDLWIRRSAILAQLGFKEETDLELLYAVIEPSLGRREFFLTKAIGWALRQYAWTDPREVKRYVRSRPELAPLSKREALKNIKR